MRHAVGKTGNTRGFTLVELVMVAAIVAIFAGLAIPRYATSINRYHATAAAQRLASDIVYAQERARAASTTRSISFNSVTSSYQLIGEPDAINPANTYTVNFASTPFTSTIAALNLGNSTALSFNAFGTPGSAGSVTLQCGTATATVTLDKSTGMVTIQ